MIRLNKLCKDCKYYTTHHEFIYNDEIVTNVCNLIYKNIETELNNQQKCSYNELRFQYRVQEKTVPDNCPYSLEFTFFSDKMPE